MTVSDTEKLEAITKYVKNMAPVVRPAVLLDPLAQAYANGWDDSRSFAQTDLLDLLGEL